MLDNQILPIDHFLTVMISDDKLTASLKFNRPDENFKCTMEQIADLLKRNGIQHGLQMEVLAQVAHEPQKFFFSQFTVAVGTAPIDGENGRIEYMFDIGGENKRPLEKDDGKVDYKEVTVLNNVKKGQLIAKRSAAKEGTPGKAVTGEVLFGRAGKDVRFKIGKNVVTDPDQMLLYATIDGLIASTEKGKINVFPVYEVNGDVDYNVGNIDFVGTVVIRGNVLSGFRVKAAGDIRVVGGVEGADLLADGSIEITAGVLGHNKGLIKAQKNVKISFIQEGNVEAGEDIIVTQSIMHSQIRAGRDVICKGSKGLIVGGTIQAGERVIARTIGNTMSTVTSIEVGVLPELRNELAQLRTKTKDLMENLKKSEKALVLLDQLASMGQLSPDKLAMRIKLNNTKKQAYEEQLEIKERILEIEKTLEDTSTAKVEVVSTIYGGSKIVIGRYTRFIKDATERVTFRMMDGEIAMHSNI